MEPVFSRDRSEFGEWLEQHHATSDALLVGYYKTGSGKASMTWAESVEEALRFGWIDGVRKGLDAERYQIRFTPRKPGSIWSAVNIAKAEELIARGRMRPAGLAAFEARRPDRSAVYSYEQSEAPVLDAAFERELRGNPAAAAFFESRPASYRKAAIHWVMSATQPDTRRRRLQTLIDDSAHGRTVRPLTSRRKS